MYHLTMIASRGMLSNDADGLDIAQVKDVVIVVVEVDDARGLGRTWLPVTPVAVPSPRRGWHWPPRCRLGSPMVAGGGGTPGARAPPPRQQPRALTPPPCPPGRARSPRGRTQWSAPRRTQPSRGAQLWIFRIAGASHGGDAAPGTFVVVVHGL
jgi:hypothetical protein